ncbi:MAG TPA: DUF6559 family protein [Candidatus Methylacidiphilales bacterium]|nr:DUF6559 family protein [Candidatus Methylacidiphilales bacterium]
MFEWFKAWQRRETFRKLARQMGSSLRQRYGFQEYYTPEQVLKTAELAGLDQESQAYAIAMYVQPEKATSILRKLASSKIAGDVREFMIRSCLGSSGGSSGNSDYNVFMHHLLFHNGSHHGGSSGEGLGQHASGGHPSGHSCGGHGGGHSCGGGHGH